MAMPTAVRHAVPMQQQHHQQHAQPSYGGHQFCGGVIGHTQQQQRPFAVQQQPPQNRMPQGVAMQHHAQQQAGQFRHAVSPGMQQAQHYAPQVRQVAGPPMAQAPRPPFFGGSAPASCSSAPSPSMAPPKPADAVLWLPAGSRLSLAGAAGPSLWWAPASRCLNSEGVIVYCTDDKPEFAYDPFNVGRDFGPLDIARTVMYCRWVDALCTAHAGCSALVHMTSDTCPEMRANSVALCGAYLVLARGFSAEEACQPFRCEPLVPFVDCRGESSAGSVIGEEDDPEFELSVLDVLRGLERARDLGWVDYRTFGVEEHATMMRPEHGDMSWLLPGRAIALASPWSEPQDHDGLPVCTPGLLAPYFHRHGVGVVVQCNHAEREEEGERRRLLAYQPHDFEEVGIRHVRLAFEDGGCPSIELLLNFLELAQTCGCGVAVHCRSGLGRTATLIGALAIQTLGFAARSFIGWARLMRPGTVHGSQQQYLVNLEPYLRPGASRSLHDLDQLERLQLLPRRELRFWALDSGIEASRTSHLPTSDIIRLVLEAHGVQITEKVPIPIEVPSLGGQPHATAPAPSAAMRAPDPAQLARIAASAAHQQQLQQPGAAPEAAASPPMRVAPPAPAQSGTAQTFGPPHASRVAADGNSGGAAPQSPPAPASPPAAAPRPPQGDRPSGASAPAAGGVGGGFGGLNAAIASLSRSLHANGANRDGKGSLSGAKFNGLFSGSNGGSTKLSEWGETLRYIRLLMAVQVEGAPSWEKVRSTLEQLRQRYEHDEEQVAPSTDTAEDAEVAKLQNEARDLNRECEQLRFRLSLEREARVTERVRMGAHGEALDSDLRRDEARLDTVTKQVDTLRERALRHQSLQRWQVFRAEELLQDLVAAKRDLSTQRSACQQLREKAALESEARNTVLVS